MNREQKFIDLKNQALPLVQNKIKLDRIIYDHHLFAFADAPGLFLITHELATPQEMAVQLAFRQIEADAFAAFRFGFEHASVTRLQDMAPQTEVRQ